MRHLYRPLFAALALLAVSHASAAPSLETQMDAAAKSMMQTHAIPRMAIVISHKGQQHLFEYGVASRESGQAVDRHTLFELGSISKLFTATLGAYAEARGTLNLSDNASQYLPELQGSAFDHISLLDLATYTSGGLPLQFPDTVSNERQMLDYYRNWQAVYPPGTQRLYSNPSIGLFGHLAAASLAEPFQQLMEKDLLPQLGMQESYVRIPTEQMEHYAWRYRDNKAVRVTPGALNAEAYELKSSATDMLRLIDANLSAPGSTARTTAPGDQRNTSWLLPGRRYDSDAGLGALRPPRQLGKAAGWQLSRNGAASAARGAFRCAQACRR